MDPNSVSFWKLPQITTDSNKNYFMMTQKSYVSLHSVSSILFYGGRPLYTNFVNKRITGVGSNCVLSTFISCEPKE